MESELQLASEEPIPSASASQNFFTQQSVEASAYEAWMTVAVRGFQLELGLEHGDFLRDCIEIRSLNMGDVIMTEDSHNDAALVYILTGCLELSQHGEADSGISNTLYCAYRVSFFFLQDVDKKGLGF